MSESVAERPKLRPWKIVRASLAIYHRHWWRLIVAAVIVFTPVAIADGLLDTIDHDDRLATVALEIAAGMLELFGAVFYAGLVAAAVMAWRSGGEHQGAVHVARHLPWRTISVLDLLIPLIALVGLILLIIPGVLALVYLSLAPAFAEMDHTGVKESMRRSVRAVRGSFWRVIAVYLLLVVLSSTIGELLQAQVDHTIGGILILVVIQAIFAPFYGLATVTITLDRRDADPTLAGP